MAAKGKGIGDPDDLTKRVFIIVMGGSVVFITLVLLMMAV